jgi:hypothetical protein
MSDETKVLPKTFEELKTNCRKLHILWCGREKCLATYEYCCVETCPGFQGEDFVLIDKLMWGDG